MAKVTPTLEKDSLYVNWEKEIKIWEAFTSLPEEKRDPAIFMTLTEAREAIIKMGIAKLTEKTGVDNLMVELGKMYLRRWRILGIWGLWNIQKICIRPSGMSISEYVIKFEQLYFKTKSFDMEILDGVLAYRSLNNTNLINEPKQLVKTKFSKMDYQIMKDQLKKVFTSTSANVDNKTEVDKTDAKPETEVYYTSRNKNYRQQNSYGGSFNRNIQYFKNKNYNKEMNPLNNKGEISRCNFYGSKFNWKKNCSDAAEKSHNDLWLYEQLNIAFLEDSAEWSVSEFFNMALCDSGCTKTVCEETWLQHYLHYLSFDEWTQIEICKSNSSFKFGESKLAKSF